jgi:hypothetical protein
MRSQFAPHSRATFGASDSLQRTHRLARIAPRSFLESGLFSGTVPEMQNLNRLPVLIDAVVDVEWGMEKPAELRMSLYRSADVRECSK